MYRIVYFHSDGVLYVCKKSNIRRRKGKLMARYLDNYWYEASCIFGTDLLHVAQSMILQLQSVKVVLKKYFLGKTGYDVRDSIEVDCLIRKANVNEIKFLQNNAPAKFENNFTNILIEDKLVETGTHTLSSGETTPLEENEQYFQLTTQLPNEPQQKLDFSMLNANDFRNVVPENKLGENDTHSVSSSDTASHEDEYFKSTRQLLNEPQQKLDFAMLNTNDFRNGLVKNKLIENNTHSVSSGDTARCEEDKEYVQSAWELSNDCQQEQHSAMLIANESEQVITPLLLEFPKVKILSNVIIEDMTKKSVKKQEFCIFCKSLKTNISRHFTTVHKDEDDVQHFLYLPRESLERRKKIEELRKKGQFMFNVNSDINQGKFIAVSRRNIDKHVAADYRICPSCKGYYAKNSIRRHTKLCAPEYIGERCTSALGRRLEARVHKSACENLKNQILPYMRDDDITRVICHDALAIASANSWCKKYKNQKDHAMIRSRLRLLGRFIMTMRSISTEVKKLSDVFKSQLYEAVVTAINEVARFRSRESLYCAPAAAHGLGGLLKKVGEIYKIQLISTGNTEELTKLNNFFTVFNHEISNDVNKTVRENLSESKRRRGIILPETEEIKKLSDYLQVNILKYENLCRKSCSLYNYKQLASHVLIDLQVFNRRRAGELERLLVADFNSQVSQPDSTQYVKVEIRGKLMRTVPLLIPQLHNNCIKLLLEQRSNLGITDDNPFVFALPSADERYKYIRACPLLRQYSAKCSVARPDLLRGTLLRKHAATFASQLNFNDSQVQNLANHLGHETKIFREIYTQPLIQKQLSIATFLQDAKGSQKEHGNTLEAEIPAPNETSFAVGERSPKKI